MKKLLLFLSALLVSFIEAMSSEAGLIQYGSQYVDEKYSPVAEENLYYDVIFVPEVTYTKKYQTDEAGKIYIHKTGTSAVVVGTPAQDFSHISVADTLISINLNNSFRQSRKIYKVAANAVSMDRGVEEFEGMMEDIKESWQISATAGLVDGGTTVVDATVITSVNVKSVIIDYRKTLRDAKAKGTTVLCNTEVYAAILEQAGAEFTPARNEAINATGNVGMWLGMMFVECQQLNEAAAKVYDNADVLQTIDLTNIDFVMYDYRAYSIIDNLTLFRVIDTTDFAGSYAQGEVNTGFQVTNSLRVLTKALV